MLDPLKLADALEAEGELHLPEGGGKISAEAFAAIVRALRELGAKPVEVTGDVRERVLEAIAATQVADLIFLCPGKTFRSLFTRDVTRPLLPRLADAALSALRPGDRIGGCVLVPAEPTEARTLLVWAVGKWNSEVRNRPLVNIHRRTLDTTWRQVIRYAGGDPDNLVGPAHDDLLAAIPEAPDAD